MSFCVVNMKKTVRFNEKATKFKIPDNPQDNVRREYLSLNDVQKTAATDMKDQFLQNMGDMGGLQSAH